MTRYNTLNAKLSNLQLNDLKSGVKNIIVVTLIFFSIVIDDHNDETNVQHKFLLTDAQGFIKFSQITHKL